MITKKKKCKKKEKEMQEMQMITTTPKKKKCKKWLSEEALQIAEKRREAKGKEEKEELMGALLGGRLDFSWSIG